MKKGKDGFYCKYVKRILDIVCALTAMIVFCWLYAIIAVFVRLKLGSPVIFKQERPGRIDTETGKERIFTLYKFRSMTDESDANGDLLSDEARLTKFGKFLRSTSLDELPEAINVLFGDMSIVGPRPLIIRYLPYYTVAEHHRHDVRPGITGLAQINGRNYVSWEDKFSMDLDYVNNVSFFIDIRTVVKTVIVVLSHKNIDTGSFIEYEDIIYRPLDVERKNVIRSHTR